MIPVPAFQAAIRAALLADPAVAQHVAPEHVRSGTVRPDQLPAIILAHSTTDIRGVTSSGEIVAEVRAWAHVFGANDGTRQTADIAGAALVALLRAPKAQGFEIDSWERPFLSWDEQSPVFADTSHGAIALRAVIRWRD